MLFRQAFAGFKPPLAMDEIAGLACETQIESRLVLEKDGTTPWEVRHGPFDEDMFAALPPSHWTLLVQDVDKWVPDAATLLDAFRFLPDWRIDDLMISIAADQGSVGPHWDDYDVFLIQGAGRREWRIDERAVRPDNCIDGIALRIMSDFQASQSWVLEPGDMLYLPPRLAHHGIALGDGCMTLSVGFRAPDQASLIEDFLTEHLARSAQNPRFRDPLRDPSMNPGLIDAASISAFRSLIETALDRDPDRFAAWLGEFLTHPKPGIGPQPIDMDDAPSAAELHHALSASGTWRRDAASRFAFIPANTADTVQAHAFVNGESMNLDDDQMILFQELCQHTRYRAETLIALSATPETRALLTTFIKQGHLYAED